MLISDWSSAVCSSDRNARALDAVTPTRAQNVPAEPEPEAAPEAAPSTVEREPPAAEVGSAEPSVAMLPPGERSQTEMDLLQNLRSEEHTSELQSLMRTSYAVFCLKQKKHK